MAGILPPYTGNKKKNTQDKNVIRLFLTVCFPNTQKIVEFLILGTERDNTKKNTTFPMLNEAPRREHIHS